MPKHYIRTENNNIIKAFSSDFEQPIKDDICVDEDAPRHFHLEKGLIDENGKHNYKYIDNNIIERTEEEKANTEDIKESLIVEEQTLLLREQAIQSLKDKGKLDANGDLI